MAETRRRARFRMARAFDLLDDDQALTVSDFFEPVCFLFL